MITIVLKCPECSGTGKVTYDHPNDPSAQDVDCGCDDGQTQFYVLANLYDSVEDVRTDYPDALSIEPPPDADWL